MRRPYFMRGSVYRAVTLMVRSDRESRIAACGLVAAVGVLAYVNTFDGKFVWDDASSVLLHRHVQLMADGSTEPLSDPAKLFQLFREDQHAFGLGQGNFYRPLVSVSFTLDFLLSYDSETARATPESGQVNIGPLLFHVTNLAWHVAAACLLLLLILRMGTPLAPAICAALLFVAHPLHTEAVAYISGRADMMSAAFMFAGLAFALGKHGAAPSMLSIALSMSCFCAGLLSKESSTAFPLLLGVLVLLRPAPILEHGNGRSGRIRRSAPLIAAVAVLVLYAALRMSVLRFADAQPNAAAPLAQRLVETGQALASYLRLLFAPTRLHMEQTLEGVPAWTAAVGYCFFVLLVVAAVAAYRTGHWRVAAGFGWFLLTWLPISGIFPLNAPLAEHWMYVPMAGFWWGLAEIVYAGTVRFPVLRYAAVAVASVLVLAFIGLTAQRNQDWHDNTSIYRATLAANPESQRVHANLATTAKTETRNFAGARRHFEETLRLVDDAKNRPGASAQFLNEAYFHVSLAALLFGETRYFHALERTLRCLDAVAAFASVPMPGAAQVEDTPLRTVVAPMGQAYSYLMLGEFDRAETGFREAFVGSGDAGKAGALPASSDEKEARAARLRSLAATASFVRAQAIFGSAIPYDRILLRLVRALRPDALLWPHRPEPFWRRLLGVQVPGTPPRS